MHYKNMTQQTKEFVQTTMANAVRKHFIEDNLTMVAAEDCIILMQGETLEWAVIRDLFPVIECFGLQPQFIQQGLNIVVKII